MITAIAEAAASFGKALLLLALPVYLAVDAARYTVSQSYRETRAAQQEALCFDLFDEETLVGDPVAEAARQEALPLSLVGKLDLFLQCATITEIGLAGIKLQQAEQNRLAELTQAHTEGVEALEAETRVLVEQAYEAGWVTAMGATVDGTGAGSEQIFEPISGSGTIGWDNILLNGLDIAPSEELIIEQPAAPIVQQGWGNSTPEFEVVVDPGISLPDEQRAALDAALQAAIADAIGSYDPTSVTRSVAPLR